MYVHCSWEHLIYQQAGHADIIDQVLVGGRVVFRNPSPLVFPL